MAFDFPQINNANINPNLVNPGASFSSAFQSGMQQATTQRGQDIQKQLTMAQLAQQAQQFSVTTELEKQRLAQQGALNMSQIAMMGAQTKNLQVQTGMTQFQADLQPKVTANGAVVVQAMAMPEASDPATGSQFVLDYVKKNAPYPGVLNPQNLASLSTDIQARNEQSITGQKAKEWAIGQTKILQEAYSTPGVNPKQYMINPNGSATDPNNFDMNRLGPDVTTKQIAIGRAQSEFQAQQKIAEIQEQGNQRLQYANTLVSGRTTSAYERSLAQHYTAAYNNYTGLVKAQATEPEISAAQQELQKWSGLLDIYKQNTGDPNAPAQPSDNMQQPGATPNDASKTGVAPTINPASKFFQQNIGQ